MDIYKLSDTLKITNLKQGVKNPNRVNVFVNDKYSFSLDIAQVVDLGVKVGREITTDELVRFKRASEYGKLYQRTLEWVLVRPRSVREVQDYLGRKLKTISLDSSFVGCEGCSEDASELSRDIIARLVNKGYLDDRKFAEYYVENRFVKKGVSQKRLRLELIKKGVDKDIIDEVLGARNDEEEIRKMIAKKRAKYDDEKLMVYLVRQGFSYDLIRQVMEE